MLKINSFFFCTLLLLFAYEVLETDGNAMNSLWTQYAIPKQPRVKYSRSCALHSRNVGGSGMKYVSEHLGRKGRLAHHGHHNHNKIILRPWSADDTTTDRPVVMRRLKKKRSKAHQLDWNKRHIALETFAKRLNATSVNGTETTDKLPSFIPFKEFVEPEDVIAHSYTPGKRTTSTTGTSSITTTTLETSATSTPTTTTSIISTTVTPTLFATVTAPTTETQTTTPTTTYPSTLSADELDPTLPNYLSFYSEVPIYNDLETIPYYLPPDFTTIPNLEIMLKRNGHERPHRNMPAIPVQATLAVQKPQIVRIVQATQAPTTVRLAQTVQSVQKIPPAAVRIPQSIQGILTIPAIPAVPLAPQVPMAASVAIIPTAPPITPNILNVPTLQSIHESQWNQMVQAAEVTQAARGVAAAIAKSAVNNRFKFPTYEDTFEQEQRTTDAFGAQGNLLGFSSTVKDLVPRTILTKIFVIPIVEEAQMARNFDLESALKSAKFALDKDMKRSEHKTGLHFSLTTLKSSIASISQGPQENGTQKATTIKTATLMKTETPVQTMTSTRTITPIKTVTPIKVATLLKTIAPVKVTPIKAVTPITIAAPIKPITPITIVAPVKPVTPITITTFATTARHQKRNKKSSSNKHGTGRKNVKKHKNKHKGNTRKRTTHRTDIKKRSTTERHRNSKHKKHHSGEIHEEYQILM